MDTLESVASRAARIASFFQYVVAQMRLRDSPKRDHLKRKFAIQCDCM
jgi:hypothetical protein